MMLKKVLQEGSSHCQYGFLPLSKVMVLRKTEVEFKLVRTFIFIKKLLLGRKVFVNAM